MSEDGQMSGRRQRAVNPWKVKKKFGVCYAQKQYLILVQINLFNRAFLLLL